MQVLDQYEAPELVLVPFELSGSYLLAESGDIDDASLDNWGAY